MASVTKDASSLHKATHIIDDVSVLPLSFLFRHTHILSGEGSASNHQTELHFLLAAMELALALEKMVNEKLPNVLTEIAAAAGVLCRHAARSYWTVTDGGGSELEFKRVGVVAVI